MDAMRAHPPKIHPLDSQVNFDWPSNIYSKSHFPLYVLANDNFPIINLTVLTEAGGWYASQPGVDYLTTRMLLEGTKAKTSTQVTAYIAHYGAQITAYSKADYCRIELFCLSQHFSVMLALLKEILQTPSFLTKNLQQVQKLKCQSLKIEQEKNSCMLHKYFKEAMLEAYHPYGYNLTEQAINAVTAEDLKQYHSQVFFTGLQVLCSGKVTKEDIVKICSEFEVLKIPTLAKPSYDFKPKKPLKQHIPRPDSLQTAIGIGKLLFPKNHPDYWKMYITTELLGGYFGSRLMRNIREEKGYTYHIYATLIPLRETTYFFIATEAIKKYTQQVCSEIYKEITRLQTQPVEWPELDNLKNYMIGHFLNQINDPFSIMQHFEAAHLHGLEQTFYRHFFTTLRQLTPEDIQQMAQKYMALDSLTEICVG